MNECLTIPQHENGSAIGCQKKVDHIINNRLSHITCVLRLFQRATSGTRRGSGRRRDGSAGSGKYHQLFPCQEIARAHHHPACVFVKY